MPLPNLAARANVSFPEASIEDEEFLSTILWFAKMAGDKILVSLGGEDIAFAVDPTDTPEKCRKNYEERRHHERRRSHEKYDGLERRRDERRKSN